MWPPAFPTPALLSVVIVTAIVCVFFALYSIPRRGKDVLFDYHDGKHRRRQHRRYIENHLKLLARTSRTHRLKREKERKRAQQDPPEIHSLENLLASICTSPSGCRWDSLIAIGDFYQRGSFPRFLPNPDVAMQCYRMAALSPDAHSAGIAQTKYIEARTTQIAPEDRSGVPLPEHFGEQACAQAYAAFVNTPLSAFEKPVAPRRQEEEDQSRRPPPPPHPEQNRPRFHDLYGDDNYDLEEILANIYFPPPPRAGVPAYKHDPQNVHDHAISSATDHNLQLLREEEERTKQRAGDNGNLIKNVERGVLASEDLTPEQRADALHVLHTLGDNVHSKYGVSERDALASVWNKIQASDNKDNLTETLAKQLASGVEAGSAVCSSGKIARIVSSLDGVSNEATARPMWVVREELGSLAAKVRDDAGGNDDEDRLKHEFGQRAREEYITRLGMSPGVVEPLIEEYSYGF